MSKKAIKIVSFIFASTVLVAFVWFFYPITVEVENPCETFVTQSGSTYTPQLRPTKSGMELLVSFTPAQNRDAIVIQWAALWGNSTLLIQPGMKKVQIRGLTSHGDLILAVASSEQARLVLLDLCFAK